MLSIILLYTINPIFQEELFYYTLKAQYFKHNTLLLIPANPIFQGQGDQGVLLIKGPI